MEARQPAKVAEIVGETSDLIDKRRKAGLRLPSEETVGRGSDGREDFCAPPVA
jgi:hypothetical protein